MASFARGSTIEKIIVRDPDDTKDQDLTLQVGPMSFYEDIIDASFHIEIMISDVFGWLERELISNARICIFSDLQSSNWKLSQNAASLQKLARNLNQRKGKWKLHKFNACIARSVG